MITCREIVEFLMDYLNGDLPRTQRATFKLHLLLCKPCRAYLRSYQDTVRLARDASTHLEDDPALQDVPEELVQAILAARAAGERD